MNENRSFVSITSNNERRGGMLLLWNTSFVIGIFAFVLAVVKLSWIYMMVNTMTSMPVASYVIGANQFMVTVVFWFFKKNGKMASFLSLMIEIILFYINIKKRFFP